MYKIVISGGPHTGKSTLIKALKQKYPSAYFIPESAEKIISQELKKQKENPSYTPIVPWDSELRAFNNAVVDEYTEVEKPLFDKSGLSFQDRSIWDSIYYCRNEESEELIAEIEKKAKNAKYELAIICEPVGVYNQSEVRRETKEQALDVHNGIKKVYEDSGIQIVSLPNISVKDRLTIIEKELIVSQHI